VCVWGGGEGGVPTPCVPVYKKVYTNEILRVNNKGIEFLGLFSLKRLGRRGHFPEMRTAVPL
jgi:hypothetical protein